MSVSENDAFDGVLRKIDRLVALDDCDRDAVRALPHALFSSGADEYLVREGQRETSCCILRSGFACRQKRTDNGARQIVSFHIPGDILDLQNLLFALADHSIQTITDATYLVVPAEDLKRVANLRPNVAEALWRDTFIDASVFREWVLNVGRRDARARIAHMLCEFAIRCEQAGLGDAETLALPMTAEQIGDATGLTRVHVNRTLASLVAEDVLAYGQPAVRIARLGRLRRIARFDATYLHAAA